MKGGLSKGRFEAIFQDGRRIQTRYARIVASPGEGRIGFTTAKAIGAKPKRNRVKRRLREVVRLNLGVVPVGLDVIFFGKPELSGAAWPELLEDVLGGLESLGTWWAKESASDS